MKRNVSDDDLSRNGRKNQREDGDGPSQPPAVPSSIAAVGGGGTYPNPGSFSERLMHVLENEITPESLWWLGEGEAIAIHPEKIEASGVLVNQFQGNRYSSFIRNLNRW